MPLQMQFFAVAGNFGVYGIFEIVANVILKTNGFT